ncbi:DUF397 domain-containing protein [Actinorugispora endophytica]|uniref:Uncharacterized protein DUF397 n=1 Tax=Actinorugispora endophytica TaxID=1605990 RepID=A0A4R6V3B8_9ACTN|nr:DUF397 domain-containing protein [Actinorugispora endophytica]TDQ53150.1 uncharacterized protein DUF397 [Actinorugispora endophytica]
MAENPDWHKSSYSSGNGGNCVEVAELPGSVLVRDTQYRELGHLDFVAGAWSAFLADVKADRL